MIYTTKGTWFVAYGCVYSQLEDGSVVRVAKADREEPSTFGAERDANMEYIAKLQNEDVGREITPENLKEALEAIDVR